MLEKANATPFLRKSLQIQKIMLSLQKICCIRQSESKLSLRSFAQSLQKIITSQGEIYEISYWNTDI